MPVPAEFKKQPNNRRTFQTVQDVDDALIAYRDWSLANPVPIGTKGRTTPRPLTFVGFAVFCNVSRKSIYRQSKAHDLEPAFERVQDAIEADLVSQGLTRSLDGNLVARVAGIADKQKVEHSEGDDTASGYDFTKLDDDEMATLQALLEKAAK